jgi:alpha-ketoglutarate-dependent taurine dioxygenase
MNRADYGFVPRQTDDPAEAATIVRTDGAVVLNGIPTTREAAAGLGRLVFGDSMLASPEPVKVLAGGEFENRDEDAVKRMPLHVDGFAYGDRLPDYIALTAVNTSEDGGESFLFDSFAIEHLTPPGANPAEFRLFVRSVAVEHTQAGMQPSVSPMVISTPGGRRIVRRSFPQTVVDPDPDGKYGEWLAWWREQLELAAAEVPRFKLLPGQSLILDNYRVLHGREGFTGERMLWRIWIWTDAALGVPGQELASDSRYAAAQ